MSPRFALLTMAVMAAAAMWLALHAVPSSELNALPIRFRRRIAWWHLHVRWVYACCAVVAAGASLSHLSG